MQEQRERERGITPIQPHKADLIWNRCDLSIYLSPMQGSLRVRLELGNAPGVNVSGPIDTLCR